MNPCLPVHVPSTCESDRERGRALRVSGRSFLHAVGVESRGESERGGLGDVTGRETHLASKFLSQHLLHVLPEVTRLQEDVLVQLEVEEHLGAPRPIPALPPLPRARSRPRFASSTAPASRDRVSRVSARGRPRSVSRGDAEVARSDDRRTVVYPSSPQQMHLFARAARLGWISSTHAGVLSESPADSDDTFLRTPPQLCTLDHNDDRRRRDGRSSRGRVSPDGAAGDVRADGVPHAVRVGVRRQTGARLSLDLAKLAPPPGG